MDFQGPTRVRPRIFSLGTSHARWALLARPLVWLIFTLPLAAIAGILVAKQEDHVPYFLVSTVLATLVSAGWAAEALSVLPVVFKWRPGLTQQPAAHDHRVTVSCAVHRTTLLCPTLFRLCAVRLVQALGLVMAAAGGMSFSLASDSQLTVEGILGLSVLVYLGSFFTLIAGLVRRCVRGFCCKPRAGLGMMRLLQYNINSCVGADGTFDPKRTADVIRRTGADVVCMQQVARKCHVSPSGERLPSSQSSVDQVHVLSELTGLHATFCSKTTGYGGEFGNAILTRWPVLETARLRLMGWKHHGSNRLAGPTPQIALAVRMRPPHFVGDVWVVCTEFGLDASGQEQLEEMRELIHWMRSELSSEGETAEASRIRRAKNQGLPTNVFVCGDFASPDTSPCMRFGRECGLVDTALAVAPQLCGAFGTYPSRRWRALFTPDKVLVSAHSSSVTIMSHAMETTASTHRPVVTIVGDPRRS